MVVKKPKVSWFNILYIGFMLILMAMLLVQIIKVLTPSASPLQQGSGSSEEQGNPLAIPALLEDINPDPLAAEFELNVQTGQVEFFPGLMTDTLGYNGNLLGPVLRVRRGQEVQIKVNNLMPDPTTAHWHGMDVDGENDGGPHQGIMPGETWTARFTVNQPAATLWYHPHFHHTTGAQVYHGLAGLIYIEDDASDQLKIPSEYGVNDIPLIIQDRNFNSDGSFNHEITMMGLKPGEVLLVNGTIDPYVNVERELIRLRVLNGSNYENFNLQMSDGSVFYQIASDGGFLEAPVMRDSLFLSPGERAEVLVDFSAATRDTVAMMNGRQTVVVFRLSGDETGAGHIPASLVEVPQIPVGENPPTRYFDLESMGLHGTINGKAFDMNRIDEEVPLNETELWVIRNLDRNAHTPGHPFHVHGTQFQVVSRNGNPPPPEERGFKDTIFVANGEEVVIKVLFHQPGVFMYHCHMLEHEEHGMMGQFLVQ
ncbi:MAG: multicopper oxidase domain-containing protein [Bacillota bacterium]|nr:multicopper oxidase domain-containing protein [Bacillota bacterium]MDW7676845.1 multicopper oxidase domain-containing protein [Bacillota bacterium]